MKLLLTSAGISNKSIEQAFYALLDKPVSETKVAYIPTAANVEMDDKSWLINDYANLNGRGFAQIDIVDISAIPQKLWQPRLEKAHVLFFGGGNTFHLKYWIEKSGLQKHLPELLKTRVWAGISAGSMVAGRSLASKNDQIFAEDMGEVANTRGLGYVDFSLKPHYHSAYFPGVNDENLAKAATDLDTKLYALDDQSAIVVNGDKFEVVSEGQWKEFN